MAELLIGCGRSRERRIDPTGSAVPAWRDLTTLDRNADHDPHLVWDLENLPLPFPTENFDEVHAYDVLEHTGAQGDYRFFFAQFGDFWRLLKPGGYLCATVPSMSSRWVWGDPSHKRAIMPETLIFLDQAQYTAQVGRTKMSDFRDIYAADFQTVYQDDDGTTFTFVLRAVKPSRIAWS